MANTDFNRNLMDIVQKYPAIYDKSSQFYKDKNAKGNAWEQVAKELNSDVPNVTKRYNTIRTRLSKYLNKLKLPSGSGATASVKPEFESLRWLITHIDHRNTTSSYMSNQQVDEDITTADGDITTVDEEDENENEDGEAPRPSKKLKTSSDSSKSAKLLDNALLQRMRKEEEEAFNPDFLFCKSLVSKFAAFNEDQRELAQIEILQVLRRIRCPSSSSHQPPRQSSSPYMNFQCPIQSPSQQFQSPRQSPTPQQQQFQSPRQSPTPQQQQFQSPRQSPTPQQQQLQSLRQPPMPHPYASPHLSHTENPTNFPSY